MPPRESYEWGILSSLGLPDFVRIGTLDPEFAGISQAEDLLAKYDMEVRSEEDDDLRHVHELIIEESVLLHSLCFRSH